MLSMFLPINLIPILVVISHQLLHAVTTHRGGVCLSLNICGQSTSFPFQGRKGGRREESWLATAETEMKQKLVSETMSVVYKLGGEMETVPMYLKNGLK